MAYRAPARTALQSVASHAHTPLKSDGGVRVVVEDAEIPGDIDMFSTRLKTRFCGLIFEHPFVLASAPPTASGPLIRTAFDYGWAGAVTKTVKPDTMELRDVSPRFSVLRDGRRDLNGFCNIELVSLKPVSYWAHEVRSLKG